MNELLVSHQNVICVSEKTVMFVRVQHTREIEKNYNGCMWGNRNKKRATNTGIRWENLWR